MLSQVRRTLMGLTRGRGPPRAITVTLGGYRGGEVLKRHSAEAKAPEGSAHS